MNHAPAVASLAKDVGGEHGSRNVLTFEGAVEIFVECDPGEIAADFDRDIGEHEAYHRRVLEDATPAFHHRFPAAQNAPPGMAALNFAIASPNALHLLHVEAFECAVKALIRRRDFLLVRRHGR
jgi:hypothetical protein